MGNFSTPLILSDPDVQHELKAGLFDPLDRVHHRSLRIFDRHRFIHDRLQTQLSHTKRKPWDPPSSPVSASNVTLSEKFVEEDNHENHL